MKSIHSGFQLSREFIKPTKKQKKLQSKSGMFLCLTVKGVKPAAESELPLTGYSITMFSWLYTVDGICHIRVTGQRTFSLVYCGLH